MSFHAVANIYVLPADNANFPGTML